MSIEHRNQRWIYQRLTKSLQLLLTAANYVETSKCDRCQMAIRIEELKETGIQATDCRWMLIGGLVEHYTETTYPGDKARSFRIGDAILSSNSCFMLTQKGTDFVAELMIEQFASSETNFASWGSSQSDPYRAAQVSGPAKRKALEPSWDAQRQELWYGGKLVKQYRIPSPNQVAILAAFEEESWPARIDDPLPQHFEIDPRRRLNDTIRNLNRSRINLLIRFSGDGSGQGILWEPEGGVSRP